MKIYLAAQFRRREELSAYAARLMVAGHEPTSRWLLQATPADGKMTNHGPEDNVRYARQDVADMERAEALLFFSEDPLVGVPRGARHVEFGWTLRSVKPIAVVGPRENVFHWMLPDRAFHTDFDAFMAALEAGDAFHDADLDGGVPDGVR